MNDIEILKAWVTQLHTILTDVRSLLLSSFVFWDVQRVIEANPRTQTQGLFNRWMATNYFVATSIGIRRQLDIDDRSMSFIRLLKAIEAALHERPSVLSRAGFIENYRPELRPVAEKQFDKLVGEGAGRVEATFVHRDIEALECVTRKVKRFANKRIAHWDNRSIANLRLEELDDCLKLLGELVDKYARLLTGTASTVHPEVLSDWKQIFKVAWITS
jgi:hypothetical protein